VGGKLHRRGGKHPNNKLEQETEGNEDIRYSDPDCNKMKRTMPKNPMKPTRII
jgi:hypothetical protein